MFPRPISSTSHRPPGGQAHLPRHGHRDLRPPRRPAAGLQVRAGARHGARLQLRRLERAPEPEEGRTGRLRRGQML